MRSTPEQVIRQALPELFEEVSDFDQVAFTKYQHVWMRCWHDRHVLFLGDAAHAMSPHLGQGVNQALEDAVGRATLLGARTSPAGVPRALAAYEGLRRDRTALVQLGSRRQGAGYDSSGSQLIDRRWIYEYDAWAEAVALT